MFPLLQVLVNEAVSSETVVSLRIVEQGMVVDLVDCAPVTAEAILAGLPDGFNVTVSGVSF